MKKLTTIATAALFMFFTSCSDGGKEVLVMGSGKLTLGENSVTIEPGSRHNEEKLKVTADKITIKGFEGVTEVAIPEAGLYVLNLKKDTLVGSYQRVVEGEGEQRITQDILRSRVDSLNQLMVGANVNATNRNFFLPPGQVARITTNTNAQVIGPYLKMPTTFEGGKDHEIYKFSTNKEINEVIQKIRPVMNATDSTK
ncbi:MAG: hypothetical protein EOP48_16010 [Sphingobacteriales bacterium]|nr:MAG: hypothetical protein EOP48_16010 [Sphingobacteriales bacterium]